MHRFYVGTENIEDNRIVITGSDVNHIKNVLRLNKGEKIVICDGQGKDYYCIIDNVAKEQVIAVIEDKQNANTELRTKIYLFQGLPKKDKMELIVQKAVELGVYEIVPVKMKRTIVKIDNEKKEMAKLNRWQTIANEASKQSRRGILPNVHQLVSYNSFALPQSVPQSLGMQLIQNVQALKYVQMHNVSCQTRKSKIQLTLQRPFQ